MKAGPRQSQFEPTEGTAVTFSDVHGVDEAKEVSFFLIGSLNDVKLEYQELQDVVAFLKDPTFFATLGGKLPKGVLLTGLNLFLFFAASSTEISPPGHQEPEKPCWPEPSLEKLEFLSSLHLGKERIITIDVS